MRYLERDVYQDLLRWSRGSNTNTVLELRGARQTGKTYLARKLAKENYDQEIYINLMETDYFLRLVVEAEEEWEASKDHPYPRRIAESAIRKYHPGFINSPKTMVIIDEIQESSKVYSMIRQLARELDCHVLVTGSYLGKTLDAAFKTPAGDIKSLAVTSMTFEEIVKGAGLYELYASLSCYGEGDKQQYQKLKDLFLDYCSFGGYPAIVLNYLEHHNLNTCHEMIADLAGTFITESSRYFEDIKDITVYHKIFSSIAGLLANEKTGMDDLTDEITKIVFKQEASRITKQVINNAVSWLYNSGIIGFADNCPDVKLSRPRMNARIYYMDLGIANYFLNMTAKSPESIRGILFENFAYLNLCKRIQQQEIAGDAPMFATFVDGEIDFVVFSRKTQMVYGVEVKSSKGKANTGTKALKKGLLQRLLYVEGNTQGGIVDKIYTIPIYLLEKLKFDF